jgi:cytoskeletal protein RodZ
MATASQRQEASLGEFLMAARERRGLSQEAVVQETHIPAHYLRMLESDDYRLISDELYLLPFLRKYATFLQLDQEDAAMRLVREVQRVDNAPPPPRSDEPLDDIRSRWRNWSNAAMFGGLVAVIIVAYVVQSRHNDNVDVPAVVHSSSTGLDVPPVKSATIPTSVNSAGSAADASIRLDSIVPSDGNAETQNDGPSAVHAMANRAGSTPLVIPSNARLTGTKPADSRRTRFQSNR